MSSLRSSIEQQLNEIELLRCCYSSADEFSLDDFEAVDEAKAFLEKQTDHFQRNLSFILKLQLGQKKTPIELQFIYPLHYPAVSVDIHLRTYLSRESYERFNEAVQKFLQDKTPSEEPYVMEFLSWLQDHEDLLLLSEPTRATTTTSNDPSTKKPSVYARLWIYSHHIFSTDKRRNIIQWAHQLHLNGFSLPGKPGIICVEGEEADVDEYWARLRHLNWKKLQIKEKELLGNLKESTGANRARFEQFQELAFVHDNSGKGDFGQLYQFLQDRQLERMFHVYFGVDGTEKK